MDEKSAAYDAAATSDVLRSVFASAAFFRAPQLRRLLEYLFACAIAKKRHLKAYTIAVEGLGRPEDFDPDHDAIVRVQAARLRRALEKYYDGHGKYDKVRILLPTGSYNLEFELQRVVSDETPLAARPSRQALIVAGVVGFLIAVAGMVIVSLYKAPALHHALRIYHVI